MNTKPTALRRLAAILVALAALAAPATASAYGWPVKPFDRQHAVRGFFGDPRIGGKSHSLHFGVDIVAANGTPVFATVSGRVTIMAHHRRTVVVKDVIGNGFEYWHVVPVVRNGQWVLAYRTIIGRVEAPWEHVHLTEVCGGRYVNPLRPGALSPFDDETEPEIRSLTAERGGAPVRIAKLSGRVDLVTEVRDWMPVAAPSPWTGKPVMPAVVRWRLVGSRGLSGRWHTAVDLRNALPSGGYDCVYAKWTRQNKPWRAGRYRIYLASRLDTTRYADGRYLVEVRTADATGNGVMATFPVTIRNGR